MESPWSTPTQSEIGEAEAALHNPKGGFFLDPPGDRELGDGEPSFDANVDDYMMAANNNIEDFDADDLSQHSSSRGATTRGSKSKRSTSKSPDKRASRSPTKKNKKGKKSTSKLDPGQGKMGLNSLKRNSNYYKQFRDLYFWTLLAVVAKLLACPATASSVLCQAKTVVQMKVLCLP